MPGPEWVPTIAASKVPDGACVVVRPKGLGVLLVRADGELYAIANKCPHMSCALTAGKLEGPVITCPCHDWRFDVRDGHFLDAPELGVDTFPTKLEDGIVLVELEEA